MRLSMDRFEETLARAQTHAPAGVMSLRDHAALQPSLPISATSRWTRTRARTSTPRRRKVLDIVERTGVLWLTLTGGEVFSRRDFGAIYEHALTKGLLVTLYTNATMVTESIARLLADRPPFSVEVSIYGADAAHYEATTQIHGRSRVSSAGSTGCRPPAFRCS
jgi:molybdenum cofactor biosynthesis enzyme MoaA